MFRKIAALFLIFSFSARIFNQAVIVLDYYANTAAFVKNCENKVRPKLHCNGKCQMMKKLKEEEKKEQQAPERKGDNKNEVVSSRSFFTTISLALLEILPAKSSYYSSLFPAGMPSGIFHPPGVV